MKKEDLKKLREKKLNELRNEILDARKDLARLRLEAQAQKLKNVHEVRSRKRKVAVLLTLVKEKQLLEKLQSQKQAAVKGSEK